MTSMFVDQRRARLKEKTSKRICVKLQLKMRGSPERQIKEKVSFFIQGLSTGVSLSMDFLIEYEDCPCFIRPMCFSLTQLVSSALLVNFYSTASRNFQSTKSRNFQTLYTQSPIIRNGHIRLGAEFWGKFKKRALGMSNLRNASKNLRNTQCSDFQS